MPPVVQGRRAPGPADAARFGVDWVRLGLGLASISVLLSQDCPRLRGCPPSGTAAPGCRLGLPFPRRRPGFPHRVSAWAGRRFGRIRGRAARRDGPIQPQYHCTPARRCGQALFVRPPPFFSRTRRRKGIARGGRQKKAPQSGVEGRAGSLVLAGRRSRGAHCRSALSQRSFPPAKTLVRRGCGSASSPFPPFAFCDPSRTVGSLAFTTAPAPVWHTTPCPFESNRSGWQLQKPACKFSHLFYYGRCREASFFVQIVFSLFSPLVSCFVLSLNFSACFRSPLVQRRFPRRAIAARPFSRATGKSAPPPFMAGRAFNACPRNATRHTPSRLAPRAFPHSIGQANNSDSGPSGTGAANSHSFPSSRRTGTPRAASAARNGSGPSSGKVSRSVR